MLLVGRGGGGCAMQQLSAVAGRGSLSDHSLPGQWLPTQEVCGFLCPYRVDPECFASGSFLAVGTSTVGCMQLEVNCALLTTADCTAVQYWVAPENMCHGI